MHKEFSILIAEDDDGHYELIKKNLCRMGFKSKIVRFVNGQDLMDYLNEQFSDSNKPDLDYLLILDIRMPKVSGTEVLEHIKKTEKMKNLPVIMLTTTNDEAQIDKCYELGCIDYVVKPVETASFAQAVHKVGLSLLMSVVEKSEIGPDTSSNS